MHEQSLPGHSVFLLLVQLALLVGMARLGAEIAKRMGLPAVVGEMTGGSVITHRGPSQPCFPPAPSNCIFSTPSGSSA